jgi:hypothetical protein
MKRSGKVQLTIGDDEAVKAQLSKTFFNPSTGIEQFVRFLSFHNRALTMLIAGTYS